MSLDIQKCTIHMSRPKKKSTSLVLKIEVTFYRRLDLCKIELTYMYSVQVKDL